MNTLILPNDVQIKDDTYYNLLRGLIYVVDKFGIDMVIDDLELLQEELETKEE